MSDVTDLRMRPATSATAVRRVNSGEAPHEIALPEFLDHFYLNPEARQAAIDPEAEPLRRARMPVEAAAQA